jgi:hypothetical protein
MNEYSECVNDNCSGLSSRVVTVIYRTLLITICT